MTAIDFLRRFRADDLTAAASRGEFQLHSHDSFKINGESSVWHWKSRDIGGRSALDYLVHVEGVGFVETVRMLCDELPETALPPVPRAEKKPFVLPAAAPDNRRVFAYLQKRGISREVIESCMRQGLLYESADYHNAVFVGRDEGGIARYAFLRGTYTHAAVQFKMEQAGSSKAYCFCVLPLQPSRKVAVYEAAIDALAHWSLEGRADKYRLSLGGVSAPAGRDTVRQRKLPAALSAFLARHPEVREIEICTDNDPAGRYAAEQLRLAYQDKYRVTVNLPTPPAKDYADMAQQTVLERAARQKAACCR